MSDSKSNFISDYEKIKCETSTIKEAWVLIKGLPYLVTDEEMKESDGALSSSRKHFSKIKIDPTFMVIPQSNTKVDPFWTNQLSWDENKKMVRIGPRFLAFHRQTSPESSENKYSRYDSEIKPNIETWLNLYKENFSRAGEHLIESITFCYINRFNFDSSNGFDTTKYFKFQLGIDADFDQTVHQLGSFSSSVKFVHKTEEEGRCNLMLDIRGEIKSDTVIQIETRSRVNIILNKTIKFTDISAIESLNRKAQKRAKKLFFQFITEETFVKVMGGQVGK